jgi:hypothetical protein
VARAEGPGVKLSDTLVLHPGIALGAGYDSNVFYASSNETGAFYVLIRPTVDLATLSLQRGGDTPHTLDFRLHLGSTIRVLASSDSTVNQHYGIGLDGGFAFTVFPQGQVSFDAFDNYTRTSEPPYAQTGSASNINYDQNQLGLRLRFHPGGNRLEIGVQYVFGIYMFENSDFLGKNDITNDFQLRVSWKFFPKTALYLNAGETTNTYVNSTPSTPPSAFPFRVVLGVIGLITAKLSVNANVGYANSFTQTNANYPTTPSYNNAIGLFELSWKPTIMTAITLGYRHDLAQGLIGTYYDLDTAYLSLSQLIWRVTAILRVGYERRDYHGDLGPDSLSNNEANQRVDNIVAGHLQLDIPIKDWLYISIADDLAKNFSNCMFTVVSPTPIACNYFRNDVGLRLGVAY